MTDEQIKQNAEKCADGFIADAIFKRYLRDTYIAGAHSRDEEIYDLKRDIEDLQKMVKMRSDAFECARKEIDRLSNPWISVEDGLPEREIVLIRSEFGISLGYLNENGTWINEYNGTPYNRVKVTYWMPIPELEGGEK